jgi:hypothetical protein
MELASISLINSCTVTKKCEKFYMPFFILLSLQWRLDREFDSSILSVLALLKLNGSSYHVLIMSHFLSFL